MEPKKPVPIAPDDTGGHTDAQVGASPENAAPAKEKPGGMASEGDASGGGAPEQAREGGMIGEG